jgi:hypothetical protein
MGFEYVELRAKTRSTKKALTARQDKSIAEQVRIKTITSQNFYHVSGKQLTTYMAFLGSINILSVGVFPRP